MALWGLPKGRRLHSRSRKAQSLQVARLGRDPVTAAARSLATSQPRPLPLLPPTLPCHLRSRLQLPSAWASLLIKRSVVAPFRLCPGPSPPCSPRSSHARKARRRAATRRSTTAQTLRRRARRSQAPTRPSRRSLPLPSRPICSRPKSSTSRVCFLLPPPRPRRPTSSVMRSSVSWV